MLELRPKYWLATVELKIKNEELQVSASEQLRLQNKVTELEQELEITRKEKLELQSNPNFQQPDYNLIRDRVLDKLKMGKQSTAGKSIDALIKELDKVSPNADPPNLGNLAVRLLVDLAITQHKTQKPQNTFEYFHKVAY